LEAEYLATFKKYVSSHESFLQKLARHRDFAFDSNFKIFLEFDGLLCTNPKVAPYHPDGQNIISKITSSGKKLVQMGDEFMHQKMALKNGMGDEDVRKFHEYHERYLKIRELSKISNKIAPKQKNLATLCDYTNEVVCRSLREQKIVETSSKASGVVITSGSKTIPLPSLELATKALAHCTKIQSESEARLASDFDLKLAIEFSSLADDLKASQTLIFRTKRTKDKISAIKEKIDRFSRQGKSNLEIGLLENQQAKLEDDLDRYETVGKTELQAQAESHRLRIPNVIRNHAQAQFKKHQETAQVLSSILDKM